MPNEEKKSPGFQTAQPKIPGVPAREQQKSNPTSTKPEPEPLESKTAGGAKVPLPYLWAAGGGAILVLVIAMAWWALGVSAPVQVAPAPTNTPDVQTAAQPAEKLPVAPGTIATIAEMKDPWSTRKFLYRDTNGDVVPAMLVHLRGGEYWAFSLREPFGTCELEFASVYRLKDYYNFNSKYPMVGDPCSRTVYDLTQYGSGPNGLVRGEIVAGVGSRPPIAIEVQVQGERIVASRSE